MAGDRVILSVEALRKIMPRCPGLKVTEYAAGLSVAMEAGEIVTVARAAAFLAQIAVESGELRWLREIWDPNKSTQQSRYERVFLSPWPPTADDVTNRLAWRLGNSGVGDGYMFRGWGPLQITGRENTGKASKHIYGDDRLVKQPALLDASGVGFLGAQWYWSDRKINDAADKLDFADVTRRINGGLTHHTLRCDYYQTALGVLGGKKIVNPENNS